MCIDSMNELTRHFMTWYGEYFCPINRVKFYIKCYSHIYFCKNHTINTPLDWVRMSEKEITQIKTTENVQRANRQGAQTEING